MKDIGCEYEDYQEKPQAPHPAPLEDHQEHPDVNQRGDYTSKNLGSFTPVSGQRLQDPRHNQRYQQGQVLPVTNASHHDRTPHEEKEGTKLLKPRYYSFV